MPSSSAIDYGVAHIYGLNGTVTYMTLQSDSISQSFKLDVEVSDEDGIIITDRLDDLFQEITIDGVLRTNAIPALGTQFGYMGLQWIIKSIEDKGTNKDFRKVTVKYSSIV
jgi:hypothetical protein